MKVEINGIRYIPERVPSKHKKPLHVLLAGVRELRGETLDEASAGIGIAKSSLFALESGATRPRLDTIQLLLGYYQINFEEIA